LLAALNTRDHEIIGIMLKVLEKLVISGDMIGEALVNWLIRFRFYIRTGLIAFKANNSFVI